MLLTVRVKPGSRSGDGVDETPDGLVVRVRERAVEGAANAAVERVLAVHFGVAPRDVRIVRGHASRVKRASVVI